MLFCDNDKSHGDARCASFSTGDDHTTFGYQKSKDMKPIKAILIIILMGACSPQIRVYTDHDPDYQVSSLASFDWAQKTNIEANSNPLYYNELTDKRIKKAVMEQLTSQGYMHAEGNPDFIIHYHIIVDDQSVVTTEPYGYYYGPYWMRLRTHVYAYREGTLIIDIMDPVTNHLIWRGSAVAGLDGVYTADEREELIKRAVEKIFKHFPRRDSEKLIASRVQSQDQ